MNSTTPTSALRELRLHYSQPTVLAVVAGTAIILGLSGPFDTFATLPLLPRLAYWMAVVALTYGTGYFISRLICPFAATLPLPLRILIVAFVIACANTVLLIALNASLSIGYAPSNLTEATAVFLTVFAICIAIESVGTVAHAARPARIQPPAILDRLPFDKRGTLIALSVSDHYVHVITTKGRDMLLMRLSDAIREAASTPGLQVHRSHWVARNQIASVRRTGDTATVTLKDGTEIPVSRSGMKALQDEKLLPVRGR